jgi:hypothetical protein
LVELGVEVSALQVDAADGEVPVVEEGDGDDVGFDANP